MSSKLPYLWLYSEFDKTTWKYLTYRISNIRVGIGRYTTVIDWIENPDFKYAHKERKLT